MSKPLETQWFIRERAQRLVDRFAPDVPISFAIVYKNDEVEWDQEGRFGRVSWDCKFTMPLGHPARANLPRLNRAIATLRARYDLGVLYDQLDRG